MGKRKRKLDALSSAGAVEKKKKKRDKKKKKDKKKKRHRSPSSSSTSTSDSSSSSSSSDHREKRKHKSKKKIKDVKNKFKLSTNLEVVGPAIPADFSVEDDRRKMAPMTKEEWEKKQSVIRKVYDETTGRHRLIKGDGEVLEEIVSKDRHKEINRQATLGDGMYFQSKLPKR